MLIHLVSYNNGYWKTKCGAKVQYPIGIGGPGQFDGSVFREFVNCPRCIIPLEIVGLAITSSR